MSDDLSRANSAGQIAVSSNQQLSESLLHERIKSEQHRLNYEKLRCLYEKLQQEMNTLTYEANGNNGRKDSVSPAAVAENLNGHTELKIDEVFKNVDLAETATSSDPESLGIPGAFPTRLKSPLKNYLHTKTCPTLVVEKVDEIIPGITAIPHNEILRQCSRWKELYLNLLDEFQQYKYGTDALLMSSDEALSEKVQEANRELDMIRAEQDIKLEKLRFRLDNMIRDRLVLQTEIKAIREQLAETNVKLREKTILCETLQRQIDEHSMSSSLEKPCDIQSHAELENKLHAAEGRVLFLQEEIEEMSHKNAQLQQKILNIIQESTKEITALRKALSGTENFVEKERIDFQAQQDEAIQHLQIQQAYIEDLDKFVNERVERNEEVSKQVQDFASQVAQETEQTLQLLEDRLKKSTEEKANLEESLLRASKVIRELTEEARRQRVTASRFITHIYQVLSIPPGDSRNEICELRTLPYVVLCDNIINSIDEDSDMAHTYAIDTKIHMKELLKRVIFWSRQFELQKKRLRERVTQLEQFQAEQKKLAIVEIDRYRKKCSLYRDILKQLRQRIGSDIMDETLRLLLPSHVYDKTGNWLSHNTHSKKKTQDEQINKLIHGTSSEKIVDEQGEQIDAPDQITSLSQAQNKFGPSSNLNSRPFVSTNLHSYLKKHERFVHILDNVEKYLSSPDECLQEELDEQDEGKEQERSNYGPDSV